jgi:hypothetical protein
MQEAMLILSQNPTWGGWKDLEWVEDLQTHRTLAATQQRTKPAFKRLDRQ